MPQPTVKAYNTGIKNRLAVAGVALLVAFLIFSSCAPLQTQTRGSNNAQSAELAEINQKIDTIYHRISVMQFMLDNHERIIKKRSTSTTDEETGLSSKITPPASKQEIDLPPPPVMNKKTPKDLYDQAFSNYKNEQFEKALAGFQEFAQKYPDSNLADNALYWAGECLYSDKKFDKSISIFKKLIKNYPEGNKKPGALLKIGYAYITLDDTVNAQMFLKNVIRNYPFSDAASKAKEKLKTLD